MVHAGPKTHPGGLKEALLIVLYQLSTEPIVKVELIHPIAKGINTQMRNTKILFIKLQFLLGLYLLR